ncbi:predicted protein [Plenodomus lingam JN3]|uniref:Predicted protein n=1 Tax=Leptosphaeria maculans (strain JN3 / isolate v23.1.3 / race Av1-4-5-6-7-8) TaxID=985895 RepID=E4ZQ74_LEPMJ|nr:predicted protein [Plenodomus lingam JN3]CBX89984.1 predicted protein [Plenodomus lingam JN3]
MNAGSTGGENTVQKDTASEMRLNLQNDNGNMTKLNLH